MLWLEKKLETTLLFLVYFPINKHNVIYIYLLILQHLLEFNDRKDLTQEDQDTLIEDLVCLL